MKTKAKIGNSNLVTCYVIAYDIPNRKRRSDGGPERSLSEDSTGGWKTNLVG